MPPASEDRANGVTSVIAPGGTAISVRRAPPLPEALREAVLDVCKRVGEVRACHPFEGAFEGGPLHLVLGLELSEGVDRQRARELVEEIAAAVQPLLAEEEVLDLVPLEGELLRTVRNAGEEIYRCANG